MTNTEYIVAINDGFNAIRRNLGTQDYFSLQNAINYLIYDFKNPRSVLEDEDEELTTFKDALESLILNFGYYDEESEYEGEQI